MNIDIIATVGPACSDGGTIRDMITAGMSVARFNFSHETRAVHGRNMEAVRAAARELNIPVRVMLDTKGSEVRVGKFKDGGVTLKEGGEFILTGGNITGDTRRAAVTYPDLYKRLKSGDRILINDGLIALIVRKAADKEIVCTVRSGGVVSDNKSINCPGVDLRLPYLSDSDKADIAFGAEQNADYIALSFVGSAEDVFKVKDFLKELKDGTYRPLLISKIESRRALDNLDDIIAVSDGIMVARGDLGAEIPLEELPLAQKYIIKKCNAAKKYVITATEMLLSMTTNPRPTRAEVSDTANAVLDGSDAVMLSSETAIGKYPVRTVEYMKKIIETTKNPFPPAFC